VHCYNIIDNMVSEYCIMKECDEEEIKK